MRRAISDWSGRYLFVFICDTFPPHGTTYTSGNLKDCDYKDARQFDVFKELLRSHYCLEYSGSTGGIRPCASMRVSAVSSKIDPHANCIRTWDQKYLPLAQIISCLVTRSSVIS